MEPFTINVNISLKEFTVISFGQSFRRPVFVLLMGYLLYLNYKALSVADSLNDLSGFELFFLIYTVLIIPLIVVYNSRRVYNQSPTLRQETAYSFSDEGVATNSQGVESKTSWENIIYRKESAKYVFLFTSITSRHIIPKALLTAAQLSDIQQRTKKKLF